MASKKKPQKKQIPKPERPKAEKPTPAEPKAETPKIEKPEKTERTLDGIPLSKLLSSPEERAQIAQKIHTRVPIHMAKKQQFIRAHPTIEIAACALEWEEDKEFYVGPAEILNAFPNHVKQYTFYYCITLSGSPFLLPIRHDCESSRGNSWHESRLKIVKAARKNWVRAESDQEAQAYIFIPAQDDYGPPVFPNLTRDDIFELAFAGRVITDTDHHLIKALQGKK